MSVGHILIETEARRSYPIPCKTSSSSYTRPVRHLKGSKEDRPLCLARGYPFAHEKKEAPQRNRLKDGKPRDQVDESLRKTYREEGEEGVKWNQKRNFHDP